ncbi:MAG: hypothetical protein QY314_04640 [Candidatus Dojkabacteria bacterium]|nr:MAG: hypothetical protein QY314_04640 [Candidatus Dojkabacteria bacterium]
MPEPKESKKPEISLTKEIPPYIPPFIIIGLGIISIASGIVAIVINAVMQSEPSTYRPSFTTSAYELVSGLEDTSKLYVKTDNQVSPGSNFPGLSIVEATNEGSEMQYISLPSTVVESNSTFAVINLGNEANPYCVGIFINGTYEPDMTRIIAEVPPSTFSPTQCAGVDFTLLNE